MPLQKQLNVFVNLMGLIVKFIGVVSAIIRAMLNLHVAQIVAAHLQVENTPKIQEYSMFCE